MRKIAEIRKDLKAAVETLKGMDVKAEGYVQAKAAVTDLIEELDQANAAYQAEQRLADQNFRTMEQTAGRSFSLIKFIAEAASGKGLTGLEAEVAEMGAEEYNTLGLTRKGYVLPTAYLRAAAGQNAGTAGDGGNIVETMPARYVESLRERLVVSKMGATVLGDLVGTLPVISSTDFTAGWGVEGATASISKIGFSKATMTPHRSFVAGAVTKDLLRQTSADVEAMLREKLIYAHAELLDKAAIQGTGSSGQPTGILATDGIGSVAGGANGAAISWANIVKLETVVNENNGARGKLGYLTNAKVQGAMKTIEKAQNTARFLYEGTGMLNGHAFDWSNLVPSNLTKGTASASCSAMIFGNWADLWIGQWGGLDIVVDPFTLAANGDIRIILNAWNDVKVVEPKSFAAIKDITTA